MTKAIRRILGMFLFLFVSSEQNLNFNGEKRGRFLRGG
jgi:hypothetical protein